MKKIINNSKLSNNKSNTSLNSNTRYQNLYNTPENNSKIQNDMNKFIKKALDKKILNNIIFSSKQNKKEKEYNNKNKRSNIAQIEPYKSVNLNINLESPKQNFRNKKIFFNIFNFLICYSNIFFILIDFCFYFFFSYFI